MLLSKKNIICFHSNTLTIPTTEVTRKDEEIEIEIEKLINIDTVLIDAFWNGDRSTNYSMTSLKFVKTLGSNKQKQQNKNKINNERREEKRREEEKRS